MRARIVLVVRKVNKNENEKQVARIFIYEA